LLLSDETTIDVIAAMERWQRSLDKETSGDIWERITAPAKTVVACLSNIDRLEQKTHQFKVERWHTILALKTLFDDRMNSIKVAKEVQWELPITPSSINAVARRPESAVSYKKALRTETTKSLLSEFADQEKREKQLHSLLDVAARLNLLVNEFGEAVLPFLAMPIPGDATSSE
jgi:hypothetical protein